MVTGLVMIAATSVVVYVLSKFKVTRSFALDSLNQVVKMLMKGNFKRQNQKTLPQTS